MLNAIRKIVVAVASTIGFVVSCVVAWVVGGVVALANTFINLPIRWVNRLMGKYVAPRETLDVFIDIIGVLFVSVLFVNPALWFLIVLRVCFYLLVIEAAYDWVRSYWSVDDELDTVAVAA